MSLAQKNEAAGDRQSLRESFLTKHNASTDLSGKMGSDASFRTYYRLSKPLQTLLMDSPAAHEPVAPFVKIAEHLIDMGLSAPHIQAADEENNFLLIEDFGDDTFTRLFKKGHNREELYTLAVDALIKIHNNPNAAKIDIPVYTTGRLVEETGRTISWYYPVKTGKLPSEELKQEWIDAWATIFAKMPKIKNTLVLRDYHCDNLMLVPNKEGVKACGLLDFQDALLGPAAYDLVSLLENDRTDVAKDLQEKLLNHYFENADLGCSKEDFLLWYRVLSAQRQSKILGLFYRLPIRDKKESYLAFVPQVCKLLNYSLQFEVLKPIADFFTKHIGTIEYIDNLDYEALRAMNLNDSLPTPKV